MDAIRQTLAERIAELERQRDALAECLVGFIRNAENLGDKHFSGVQDRLIAMSITALTKAG